jgi:drug/metabolite transporter (DMT)-like permease
LRRRVEQGRPQGRCRRAYGFDLRGAIGLVLPFCWLWLVEPAAAVTTGILGVFASTVRVGPFRTAVFMNLEPLLATIGSALFLGEVITPLQPAVARS